ncbi:MAG: hypothetical protein ABRQ39_02545, partial [Candidatus Eremiobacterota bacterium]
EWNKSEIQEIYNQLSSEMSQWKPLVQYNSSAKFFTLYSDSPINVNSDGYFEADVPVQSNDNTAAFEVVLNDGEHFSVNRTSFADLLTSTGENSEKLKSCSRSVYALPGGISIFKVFASINLKESGLSFSLNDSFIGTVTPPFYLKIRGQEIFNIGYGVFRAKQEAAAGMGKTGTITASTSSNGVSGQNIPMPVEIVHETVSISGKVFTDGSPLIDGHVKSIGPKSFCHLDAEGNYVLPEVFEGTNREVIATWWTDESGKRTKHVEIKYIDSLNEKLTNFNFGVPPEPTPTPTLTPTPIPTYPIPPDPYYDNITTKILEQKIIWQEELGRDQGRQKTVEWLNQQLPDFPLPLDVAGAIEKAELINSYTIVYTFKSGHSVYIIEWLSAKIDANTPLQKEKLYSQSSIYGEPVTLKNKEVLMLGPKAFEDRYHNKKIFGETDSIRSTFQTKGFNVTYSGVINYKLDPGAFPTVPTPDDNDPSKAQILISNPEPEEGHSNTYLCRCTILDNKNLVMPNDFLNINNYGVVFITAHGVVMREDDGSYRAGIQACPLYETLGGAVDSTLNTWLTQTQNKNMWDEGIVDLGMFYKDETTIPSKGIYQIKIVMLKPQIFTKNFTGSLVVVNACDAWELFSLPQVFQKVQVYVAPSGVEPFFSCGTFAYHFFSYMLGTEFFDMPPYTREPAYIAFASANDLAFKPLQVKMHMYAGPNGEYLNTYLPTDGHAILQKNE